jgi:hypothetical protein
METGMHGYRDAWIQGYMDARILGTYRHPRMMHGNIVILRTGMHRKRDAWIQG